MIFKRRVRQKVPPGRPPAPDARPQGAQPKEVPLSNAPPTKDDEDEPPEELDCEDYEADDLADDLWDEPDVQAPELEDRYTVDVDPEAQDAADGPPLEAEDEATLEHKEWERQVERGVALLERMDRMLATLGDAGVVRFVLGRRNKWDFLAIADYLRFRDLDRFRGTPVVVDRELLEAASAVTLDGKIHAL